MKSFREFLNGGNPVRTIPINAECPECFEHLTEGEPDEKGASVVLRCSQGHSTRIPWRIDV